MAFVLIMIIYIMVIMYGSHTLTAVIEEKSSRMVEVLLASISPGDLMMGKVVGIGLASFAGGVDGRGGPQRRDPHCSSLN